MNNILILSIYDGGYQASIGYDNCIYDLTKLDEYKVTDYNKNIIENLKFIYDEYIKENNWYSYMTVIPHYLFNIFKDICAIIVCEDGYIGIYND